MKSSWKTCICFVMKASVTWYVISVLHVVMILQTTSSESANLNHYVVEMRVVVDLAGKEKLKNETDTGKTTIDELLTSRMRTIFEDVNDVYYRSLRRFSLYMELVVKDLVILDYNLVNPEVEDKVSCFDLLSAFKHWVRTNNTEHENSRYDASILFTGFDLYLFSSKMDDSGVTSGLSSVGLMCKPLGTGVLELSGTANDAFIASHEIGHILGAPHDGLLNETPSCDTSDGYVMSEAPNVTSQNHALFSVCSALAISNKIAELDLNGHNCMTATN